MSAEEVGGASLPTIDEGAREVLLEQERVLCYPERFGAQEALELGCRIAELAREYDRGITAVITREEDDLTLFEWAQDDKAPRNAAFAAGKRAAAAICGHASLMCCVEHELTGAHDELFRPLGKNVEGAAGPHRERGTIPVVCPVGGAFPLRVGDDWVATLAISGLHDGLDHELCVRALARALGLAYGTKVPAYRYPAI